MPAPISPSVSGFSSLRRAIRWLVRMSKVSKDEARDEVMVLRFGTLGRYGSWRWCHTYAVIDARKERWLNRVINTVVDINLLQNSRNIRAEVEFSKIRPARGETTTSAGNYATRLQPPLSITNNIVPHLRPSNIGNWGSARLLLSESLAMRVTK